MESDRTRLFMGLTGLALVFGFFMPWIDIGGYGLSGYDLATADHVGGFTRLAFWLCPISGAVLCAAAFGSWRMRTTVAALTGGGVLGYTFFKLAYGFVKITGWGLWLVLAAGAVALVIGLTTRTK